jgi:hypothetical protein
MVCDASYYRTIGGDCARANTRTELAFRVAGLVYDEVGGDPASRPKEFL